MKKDFVPLVGLSVCFLWLSFFPLGRPVALLRQIVFYLIYPANASLSSVLEYGPSLGKSWSQLFRAQEEVQRLEGIVHQYRLSSFAFELQQQESANVQKAQALESRAAGEFRSKNITFVMAKVRYRGVSPAQWVSRLCVETSVAPRENIPAITFDAQTQNFVFLGKMLPLASNFGRFPCIELMTSPDFNLLIQAADSGEEGLLRGLGEPKRLVLEFLPKNSATRLGEIVVTSQGSMIAPAGIAVGRVVALEEDRASSLFGRAYVEPFVDLNHIEDLVLLSRRNLLSQAPTTQSFGEPLAPPGLGGSLTSGKGRGPAPVPRPGTYRVPEGREARGGTPAEVVGW